MPRLAAVIAALLAPCLAQAQGEPHAWLFGAWSGGLAPPDWQQPPLACLAQPQVIFTRDIVLHQTLLDPTYQQRIVETVRVTPEGAEIRFRPLPPRAATTLPGHAGFGCGDANLLRVKREPDGSITFPGCVYFPSPLIPCAAR